MRSIDAAAAAALLDLRRFVGDADALVARMKVDARRAKKKITDARRRARLRAERDARRKAALDSAAVLPAPVQPLPPAVRAGADANGLLPVTVSPLHVPAPEPDCCVPTLECPSFSARSLAAITRCTCLTPAKRVRFSQPLVSATYVCENEPIVEHSTLLDAPPVSAQCSSLEQLLALRTELTFVSANDALLWTKDRLRYLIKHLCQIGGLTYTRLPHSQPQLWYVLKYIRTYFC